jgi:tetratricopeptide (TPR) repeat protein
VVVEENNLQVQISALRRLLGAQAIATVPGRGYQFIAEIVSAGAPSRQRLAAILAANVAGYFHLMAADESATVAALVAARGVFREQIESRQGRVVDLTFAGRSDEAVASLKEALRLSPIDRFTFLWIYLLGFAEFLLGREQQALDLVEQSLRDRPSFPGPHRIRAACLSQMGRIDEARGRSSTICSSRRTRRSGT